MKSRAPQPSLVLAMWLIPRLIPYARNPRLHPDTQVTLIADSITQFGFNNPIL
jgi:hypothetical protein